MVNRDGEPAAPNRQGKRGVPALARFAQTGTIHVLPLRQSTLPWHRTTGIYAALEIGEPVGGMRAAAEANVI